MVCTAQLIIYGREGDRPGCLFLALGNFDSGQYDAVARVLSVSRVPGFNTQGHNNIRRRISIHFGFRRDRGLTSVLAHTGFVQRQGDCHG